MSKSISLKKMLVLFVLVFVNLFGVARLLHALSAPDAPVAPQATTVSGPIYTDTVWTAANSPYVVTDTVTVHPGATLTIEPGVLVQADRAGFAPLLVEEGAGLLAGGTTSNPITFTAVVSSGPGSWDSLAVRGTAVFSHTRFQNGTANLFIEDATGGLVSLAHSRIENAQWGAFIYADALHRLQMHNMTFTNNITSRVLVDATPAHDSLTADATLAGQPGLDGYEFIMPAAAWLTIPQGVTLTLSAGATLLMPDSTSIGIDGYLAAAGTVTNPVTFTSVSDSASDEWAGLGVSGSAHLRHAVVRHSLSSGVFVGPMNQARSTSARLENVTLEYNDSGVYIDANILHQLQMTNTTFRNNTRDRVLVEAALHDTLTDNVMLTTQPGLKGYEFIIPKWNSLVIPEGVTLTLSAGATLFMPDSTSIGISGFMAAAGTVTNPVTFTSISDTASDEWAGLGVLRNGSAHLRHAVVRHSLYSGIFIGPENQSVRLENVILEHNDFGGLHVYGDVLHQLQMTNTRFRNNGRDRVLIYNPDSHNMLADNVVLSAQPGLEGYELTQPSNFYRIPTGMTLTVEAGVTLLVPEYGVLDVRGGLNARATAAAPITFTSATTASWAGIYIGGTGVFEHVHLSDSGNSGIYVDGGTVTAVCSTFTNNYDAAVLVTDNGTPSVWLSYNNIADNLNSGVLNNNATTIRAPFNWWGAADGPGGSGPGSGAGVFGSVHYTPWLTAPADCPVATAAPTVQFAQAAYTATEAAGSVAITVTLSRPVTTVVSVTLLADEVPTAVLTFTAGMTSQVYLLPVVDDSLDDGDELRALRLANAMGAMLGERDAAVLTILDDDLAQYLPIVRRP